MSNLFADCTQCRRPIFNCNQANSFTWKLFEFLANFFFSKPLSSYYAYKKEKLSTATLMLITTNRKHKKTNELQIIVLILSVEWVTSENIIKIIKQLNNAAKPLTIRSTQSKNNITSLGVSSFFFSFIRHLL